MLDSITRPIQALMVALRFKVSLAFASKVLTLMDKLDRGELTELEFIQAGAHLGEIYPQDYKRAMSLFVEKPKDEG
jgi:hypothetical protein